MLKRRSSANDRACRWIARSRALAFFAATLLVLLSGCGGAMSPEEKAAIGKIQELGGKVTVVNGGYRIELGNTPVVDKDLECIKDLGIVRRIDLTGTTITNAGLAHLEPLTDLEFLSLERTLVTRDAADKFEGTHEGVDVRH
jgi:hypothetical protein